MTIDYITEQDDERGLIFIKKDFVEEYAYQNGSLNHN